LAAGCLGLVLAAACGGSGTAPNAGRIAAIVISPDSLSLATGDTEVLRAQARAVTATPLDVRTFFWSTSDSLVATVTQSGVVTARRAGAVQIGASAQGTSGFARVLVFNAVVRRVVVTPPQDTVYATAPSDSATLTAHALDAAGDPLPRAPIFWSSSSTIATVSPTGVVTATGSAPGTATISAMSPDSGEPTGMATVVVVGHTATISVNPTFAYLKTGGAGFLPATVQVVATLTDTFGHDVSAERPVTWSSADPTVATVDPKTGLVTAVATAVGSTQITATAPDGPSASMTVTVFP